MGVRLRTDLAIGIDTSHKRVIAARKYANADPLTLKKPDFMQANATELPLQSNSIDIIVSRDVIEHIERPDLALMECARVLKPERKLYLSFGPPWLNPWGGPAFEDIHIPWTMKILYHHRTLGDGAEGIYIAEMANVFCQLGHKVHMKLLIGERICHNAKNEAVGMAEKTIPSFSL